MFPISQKKQKKLAKLPNGNHSDPFAGDENDDVERITRELEAKYVSERVRWRAREML